MDSYNVIRCLLANVSMVSEWRTAFLLRNEPQRAFGYKTADTLIQEGRADAVIAYLESLAGGAAG